MPFILLTIVVVVPIVVFGMSADLGSTVVADLVAITLNGLLIVVWRLHRGANHENAAFVSFSFAAAERCWCHSTTISVYYDRLTSIGRNAPPKKYKPESTRANNKSWGLFIWCYRLLRSLFCCCFSRWCHKLVAERCITPVMQAMLLTGWYIFQKIAEAIIQIHYIVIFKPKPKMLEIYISNHN